MEDVQEVLARYEIKTGGKPNLIILKSDDFLTGYGLLTTLAQTFVDIWNLEDWFAKEFSMALKRRIDELLP